MDEQEVFHIVITWNEQDQLWSSDDTADERVRAYYEACLRGGRAAVDVLEAMLPNGPPPAVTP